MAELRHKRSFGTWIKRMSSSNARSWSGQSYSKKPGVFGIPLVESVCYARSTVGYVDEEAVKHRRAGIVPLVVAKCGSFLKAHALDTEGVFRKSGGMKRVAALQSIFDDPRESYGLHLNWLGYGIHDAANVLCRYLQRLPEPVIPHAFYEPFRDVMSDRYYQKTEARIQAFQHLIRRLPIPHQHLLLYLLDLLSLFASHEYENRMGASNLAVVFGPSILRHPRHNDPIQHRISQRVLEFLIEFQALFTMKMLDRKLLNNTTSLSQQQQPPLPPPPPPQQESNAIPSLPASSVRLPSPPPDPAPLSSNDRSTPQSYHFLHPHQPVAPTTPTTTSIASQPEMLPMMPRQHPSHDHQEEPGPRMLVPQTWLAQPYGFWPCMAVSCGILGTFVYEAYEATRCCRVEPYLFFVGFIVYCMLLIQGIAWPDEVEQREHDDELSLFDDLSEQTKDNEEEEEAMLRDIACEWHSLFSRSWRDQETTLDPDQMSIRSAASRFDEEGAELTSSDEDADDSSFDIESVDLQSMWQRQQDASELQKQEEWKIRRYSQPQ